jgi:diguanylate cyclase (GGDEF)-like protein
MTSLQSTVNAEMRSAGYPEAGSAGAPAPVRPQLLRSQQQQLTAATLAIAGGIPLMVAAAAIGRAPWIGVLIWAPLSLLMNLLAWAGLKFDWTHGWRDPVLTAPQIAWAIGSTAACYAMLGPLRGVVLPMLALALLFAIFALPARTVRWLTVWTLALYGAVMIMMSRWQPDRFPPLEEAIYFGFLLLSMPPMALLAARMSELRARLGRQKSELEQALERIRQTAERDELTDLFNRRRIHEELLAWQARAQRGNALFAVAMIDIDHFKRINDLHGHAGGDAALRHFARVAQDSLRVVDALGRWGGEEFLAILASADAAGATMAAERVRLAVAALGVELPDGERIPLTVSIGLAWWQEGESIDRMITRADQALYRAKAQGRDRVVLDGSTEPGSCS